MRLISALTLFVLISHPLASVAQQSNTAPISLRGRVSRKVMISPSGEPDIIGNGGGVSARLISTGDDSLVMRVVGSSQAAGARISARLLMRTNTRYELFARLSSAGPAPRMNISVKAVHPTGSLVVSNALASIRHLSSPVELSSTRVLLAGGSRISLGSPVSPRNAIEILLLLEVMACEEGNWSADAVFDIKPA